MQRATGSVFSHWSPGAVCRQRGTSLVSGGAQGDLSLENAGGWHKVWAPPALLLTALGGVCPPCPPWTPPGRSCCSCEGRAPPEPKCRWPRCYGFASAFLQVLTLRGRQQNLSFLPGSTLPPPLMKITVSVQQVINHTPNSTHKSGHPALPKFLLQWDRSTRWFVIQSSISLGNV